MIGRRGSEGGDVGPTAGPGTPGLFRIFRLFGSYVRPYRRLLAGGAVLAAVEIVLGLAGPWPLKVVIDSVLVPLQHGSTVHPVFGAARSAKEVVALAIAASLVVVLLAALADYWSTWLMESGGRRIGNDIREGLFAHLQRLSMRFHGASRVGDLSARITGDVDRIQDLMVQALSVLVPNVLLIVGMVVVMVVVDPVFTIFALIACPPMAFAIHRSTHAMKGATRAARAADGDVAAQATESLNAIQVVQAFALESRTNGEFATLNRASLTANLRAVRHQARLGPLVDIAAAIAAAVVLAVGAQRVIDHDLTIGTLLVFLTYLGALYKPIRALSKLTFNISRAAASAERVHVVLCEVPDVRDAPTARAAPLLTGHLALRDVTFSYGREPVLRSVSFAVEPGEVVALVGPTGAGKSTVAALIPRFFEPDSGAVEVDGVDVRTLTLATLRRQIALVLQESVLLRASLFENIAVGRPMATVSDVHRAARLALVNEFSDRFPAGLDTIVGERGANLSGGQRQRVAIARAILRNAPMLILDEPTSALDAVSEALVVEALENLMVGRTTIVIAHRLSTVRRADRIIVLERGTVVEEGSHAELVAHDGAYARLARLQYTM